MEILEIPHLALEEKCRHLTHDLRQLFVFLSDWTEGILWRGLLWNFATED